MEEDSGKWGEKPGRCWAGLVRRELKPAEMTLFQTQISLSTVPIAASAPVSAEDPGAPGIGRHHSVLERRRGSDLPQPNPRAGKVASSDRLLRILEAGCMGSE